jgi:hypothetical protein
MLVIQNFKDLTKSKQDIRVCTCDSFKESMATAQSATAANSNSST